jgi:hypothetical protein
MDRAPTPLPSSALYRLELRSNQTSKVFTSAASGKALTFALEKQSSLQTNSDVLMLIIYTGMKPLASQTAASRGLSANMLRYLSG